MCSTNTAQVPSTPVPLHSGQPAPASALLPGSIEVDEVDALDNDSAFGDDTSEASSRTSLSSGIARYRTENGRRYHAYKEGNYLFPNDETEQDRLDLHHHIFNLVAEGKLFYAPIDNPSRVLDAGTGTGIWAMDFADQFPGSYVLGTDLSPIQPGWVPPNLEFEVDDMEDTWRHKPFSFIHLRCLAGSLKDWPRLLSQAYDNLEPGGWLEVVDFELYLKDQRDPDAEAPGLPVLKDAKFCNIWVGGLHEAAEKIGRTFRSADRCKGWMESLGFEGLVEEKIKVPVAPWAKNRRQKEIGLYQQQNSKRFQISTRSSKTLTSLSLSRHSSQLVPKTPPLTLSPSKVLDASSSYGAAHFTRVLGWSSEEFEVLSAGVRGELKDRTLQLYSNLFVVYGRKPRGEKEGKGDE
ncbi:putative methyltransferase [Leptodontidium sp. MPI-SDFR-AT-0119]|nr:putative methyltransferase [Leptodontidium sp. MPI-SDFR-AT-0119]